MGATRSNLGADADRERRLPPRLSSRARPTRRSRCGRTSHHGVKKRTAAHARGRFKRENGEFWRAQFCTEVARPTRFEPVTFCLRRGKFRYRAKSTRIPRVSFHLPSQTGKLQPRRSPISPRWNPSNSNCCRFRFECVVANAATKQFS
jgi:hypothetical protein